MIYSSWCCPKCGDSIGWVGRFLFPFLHPCCPLGLKFGKDFNQTLERCNIRCPEDKREACRVEKEILSYKKAK